MTDHKPAFSAPAADLSPVSRLGLGVYSGLWYAALPGALAFKRLRSGLWPRLFSRPEPRETDVWIQAASAGECTLAQTLLHAWPEEKPVSCLATANTPQGMQVLDKVAPPRHMLYSSAYAPLDTGSRMRRTINALRPRVVVLLETELWPNLLAACAKANIPVLLLNARMTPKSLSWYSRNRALWARIGPCRILAVDQEQASRYAYIFGQQSVGTMRNIKFDRWSDLHEPLPYVHNPLSGVFKAQSKLVVYGSVRTEEEPVLLPVLSLMAQKHPRAVQAVFPRHMHRIPAWKNALQAAGLSWTLRSRVRESVPQGTVVLWDCMGELESAYALARSVFIGGSLAPKGGQNFLESLAQGVVPCIGPWWSNFSWVGTDIVNQGLLTQVSGAKELVSALSQGLRSPQSRDKVHQRFARYLGKHQGGTRDALAAIHQELK